MRDRRVLMLRGAAAVAAGALLARCPASLAVSWNATTPADGAITTVGLSDQPSLFIDENVVNDTANSTRGTGTYLGNGWVLTALHVITGSANIYGTIATPSQITMTVNIGGANQNYTADTLLQQSGNPDIALIHLAGTNTGPIAAEPGVLASAIYSGQSENGGLVQLGGYGYYGPLAGTLSMDASFHRAFNVVTSISNPFLNVTANNRMATTPGMPSTYVMGIGESGDSGSGLWLDTSGDLSDTNLWDYSLAGELNTTSNTNAFGSNNQYERVTNNSGWILTNAYASRGTVTWDLNSATAGIQEGSGTWDLSTANFGNGQASSNVAWDNGTTTMNANFGAHKGAAGTVTLGANISVGDLQFNPALTGNYTIAGSGSFTLSLSSTSILTADSGAVVTISAPLIGGGGTILKLGTGTIILSGTNTFTGTLQVGNNATSGGNTNGALRIASSGALNGVSTVNLQDNNSAYPLLQFDGTTANGNITISHPAFTWSGNNAGPAGTAATIFESIGGTNSYTAGITGNSGGIGYGIAVDAGSMTFNTFTTTTSKTLYFRGAGNGSFSGVVSGANVGVNVTDSGTWTLNAANTYSLATTIAGGVLSTNRLANGGSASGIGNSSNAAANLVLSGGTLSYVGGFTSINRLFTVGPGGGTIDGSGSGALAFSTVGSIVSSDAATHAATTAVGTNLVTITAGGETDLAVGMSVAGTGVPAGATITAVNPDAGTISLSAFTTVAGSATLSFGPVNRTLTLTGSTAVTNSLQPALANSAGGGLLGLTKTGAGIWALGGANTNTGPTLVSVGSLTLNSGASLASPSESVSSGATFTVNGLLSTSAALTDNGMVNINTASQTIALLNGGGTLNIKPTPLTISGGGSFSGSIGSTGSLAVSGGALVLSGTNNYGGSTSVSAGSLEIASGGSITSVAVSVSGGASLSVDSGAAISSATNLTDGGVVNFSNVSQTIATLNGGGSMNLASTALTISGGGSFSGAIGGNGSVAVNGGALILSGINNYTGSTSVSGGSLEIASGGSIAGTSVSVVSPGSLTVDSGAAISTATDLSDGGTVNLNNLSQTIATLNGGGALNLGSTALTVTGGGAFSGVIADGGSNSGVTVSGGTLALSGVNTFTGATHVTGGTITLASTGAIASTALTVDVGAVANVNGSLTASPTVTANGSINFGTADLNNDPTSTFLARSVSALTIGSGGNVAVATATSSATRSVLVVPTTVTNDGTLDLTNNDMIVKGGDVSAIAQQVVNGKIISSTAANSTERNTALAVVLDADNEFSTFDDQSVANGDVLVKFTFFGDANLDGVVDSSDYTLVDNGFNFGLTGWFNGDFNYDGKINGDDYSLLDNAFNTQQLVTLAAASAGNVEMIAGETSQIATVPEPTSAALLALAAGASLMRRRRR